MQDFQLYEQGLLASIPHRFRHDVYNAIKAFETSQVLLHTYACAAKALPWPQREGEVTFSLAAFGSLGRLDGSPLTSDYDILHLYSGSKNEVPIRLLRDAVRNLLMANKGLPFDQRDRVEARTLDFNVSQAYQILSAEEVLANDHETQALQLLTEGRMILDNGLLVQLRRTLAAKYGYDENEHALNFTPLRAALDRLRLAYGKDVIGRLAKQNKSLNNHRILKLFALREFSYLATLFSLAESAIAVAVGCLNPDLFVRILSAPCLVKIASFANPSAALSQLVNCQSPEVVAGATHVVRRYVRNMLQNDEAQQGTHKNVQVPDLASGVRILALIPLGKYDALLQRLHDPRFLSLIDAYKPDVTTWISEKEFSKVLHLRTELLQASVVLAKCLVEILECLNTRNQSPALEDARTTLSTVTNYRLESKTIEVSPERSAHASTASSSSPPSPHPQVG